MAVEGRANVRKEACVKIQRVATNTPLTLSKSYSSSEDNATLSITCNEILSQSVAGVLETLESKGFSSDSAATMGKRQSGQENCFETVVEHVVRI